LRAALRPAEWIFSPEKPMKSRHVVAAALVLAASAAGAQSLKPGLWEVTHKMQTSGDPKGQDRMAQMNQQMAKMPPEQRKKVEEMMAKNGVKMGSGSPGGGMSMKICMTKEMVERNDVPAQQGDCKTTRQSRSGNTMKTAFSCGNPPSSGEGQITFLNSEAYTTKMVMTSMASGKPQKIDMEGGGKWLGADCGNIKPIAPPKKG
jgi:hypothetical protein